ncbi:hypothetical protein HETIRDRAFT_313998 [Heterobasidion irregulare TC 32-1]|uniref:Uncharacterized protein n=1 Tax=Heterobasidion irregulare (strain TC 32-1) TaxID=747525 RepID=W4KHM5_HETIT|nr:uncharacterized protein HETIRDRAFT_313998 [Heterobasidion irregulare TC 32-1]ETW84800.1 hypothetical protein HETIRDRAFT_313998 [Heterobasidion irregulare TC 32-1]
MIAVVCVDAVEVKMSSGKVVVIVIEFAEEVVCARVVGLNTICGCSVPVGFISDTLELRLWTGLLHGFQ